MEVEQEKRADSEGELLFIRYYNEVFVSMDFVDRLQVSTVIVSLISNGYHNNLKNP